MESEIRPNRAGQSLMTQNSCLIFKNVEDLKSFVMQLDYNLPTRITSPLLISTKISGVGFSLACDCLKELGSTSYPKPDVHLTQVFVGAGLSSNKPI